MSLYKQIVQEKLSEKYIKEGEDDISKFLSHSLYIISQTHIWHWMTKNGQTHESIGEFYKSLQDTIDNTAERFIGKYNPNQSGAYTHKLVYNLENSIILDTIDTYDNLVNDIISRFDKIDDASIVDSLVDIKELIDTLRFKLRLG